MNEMSEVVSLLKRLVEAVEDLNETLSSNPKVTLDLMGDTDTYNFVVAPLVQALTKE